MINIYRAAGRADFTCTHYDCPEFFEDPTPDCIYAYELDSCCSTKKICGKEITKLAKCYLDGNEYFEGQRMYPENGCFRCLCNQGFNNKTFFGNPSCKERECGFELYNLESFVNGCVPIYYGNSKCCPIDFRCRKYLETEIKTKRFMTDFFNS